MFWIWRTLWLLCGALPSWSIETKHSSPTLSLPTTASSLLANFSQPRLLGIEDRQDQLLPPNSYYPYQAATYPSPSYGPPTTELPVGMVQLELAFDDVVLRCITEEPYEHIVWTKYQCPQQFCFGGEGVVIADGSSVSDDSLYDVHIRGHDGTIISELLIKKPQDEASEGIYQCEAWPHIHGGGGGYSPAYGPYQTPYSPPKSNTFIIGGNALLETCYCNIFGASSTSKLPGFINKQSSNNNKDVKDLNKAFTIKPRRNSTSSRKDSNSKQLNYNLRYDDDKIYNVEGKNVTADFFRPIKINPFNFTSPNQSSISKATRLSDSFSKSFFEFSGRSNDRFRDLAPKLNNRKAKM